VTSACNEKRSIHRKLTEIFSTPQAFEIFFTSTGGMKKIPFVAFLAASYGPQVRRTMTNCLSSEPAQPTSQAGGEVQCETQKRATSFGLALDMSPNDLDLFQKAVDTFPGALTNHELVKKISSTLESAGYDVGTTLLSTSFCCDELNRSLEVDLANKFRSNFNMGGLAGFPFGGPTGFGAMASHIPDGGSCLIVFGPHVGVDSTGAVGTIERWGRVHGGPCCGSGVVASNYVAGVLAGKIAEETVPDDALDAQQYFVGKILLPYAEQLEKADDRMMELPNVLYDAQSKVMKRLVQRSASTVVNGDIAVVGGIQINTPEGFTDYFLPLSFNVYDNKGQLMKQLW